MRLLKIRLAGLLMLTMAIFMLSGSAQAVSMSGSAWNGSGPGSTTVSTPQPKCTTFDYSLSGSAVWSRQTWNASTTAPSTGTINIDWNYWGFHAWFATYAGLTAWADGPSGRTTTTLGSGSVGGGFNWSGTVSLNVTAGYPYGFTMQGQNFDSDARLIGNLKLCEASGSVASQPWSSSGPGVHKFTLDSPPPCVIFDYSMSGSGVWSRQTWNLTQLASSSEQVTLDWQYSGFHAWFMTYAGLTAWADGPGGRTTTNLGSGSVGGGFNWDGTTVLNLTPGYKFGFTMQGQNFDSDARLIGKLQLCLVSAVELDTIPPTISASGATAHGQPYLPATWTNQDVTVSYLCADLGGSGVHSCSPAQTFTASGVAQGIAVDGAGNQTLSDPLSVNIDKTAPTITPAATTADGQPYASGAWTNQDVTVAHACADTGGSGVASCPDAQTFSASGGASGTATDGAGNTATSDEITVNIDKTAPTITAAATTADGQPYASAAWTNQGVIVTYVCADSGGSGVASCPDPQTFSASGSASGTATDGAGNSTASDEITVSIDKVDPTVTWSGNDGLYTVDQSIHISCSASDADSGLSDTTGCIDISGDAYGFGIGTHSNTASATDHAGNSVSVTINFTIVVNHDSLSNLTEQFVSNSGVAKSMVSKLKNAQAAASRGQDKAAANMIQAYANELKAQSGKAVSKENAELLTSLADSL